MDKTGGFFKISKRYSEVDHQNGLKDLITLVWVLGRWEESSDSNYACWEMVDSHQPVEEQRICYPAHELKNEIDGRDLILYTHYPEKSSLFFTLLRVII
jgi:hypothetical protein